MKGLKFFGKFFVVFVSLIGVYAPTMFCAFTCSPWFLIGIFPATFPAVDIVEWGLQG